MRMRKTKMWAILMLVLFGGVVLCCVKRGNGNTKTQNPIFFKASEMPQAVCSGKPDISLLIEGLRNDPPETSEAVRKLIDVAKAAPECRIQVIQNLVSAMNKPNLNLEADRNSFLLWSRGAYILGELKAVEALDFLIDHLNINDGYFSASMAHQPAIHAVEAMSTLAVPKLSDAIKHNSNRDIRLAAALCLGDIGGHEATNALKEVASTDPDECVRRFIELSLMNATREVLQQRLVAYRCGN